MTDLFADKGELRRLMVEKAQAMSLALGIRPEENLLSRGIIEMRADAPAPLLWDAGGLAKWCVSGVGSSTVNALFVSGAYIVAALLGCAATYSVLFRPLNDGRLAAPSPLP